MKKLKKVLSLVLVIAMVFPLFPTPQVQAQDTGTVTTSQFTINKDGAGTCAITINDSSGESAVGNSFKQTYNVGEKIKVNIKAETGSMIDYVKLQNGTEKKTISYDEMTEYSSTFTINEKSLSISVGVKLADINTDSNELNSKENSDTVEAPTAPETPEIPTDSSTDISQKDNEEVDENNGEELSEEELREQSRKDWEHFYQVMEEMGITPENSPKDSPKTDLNLDGNSFTLNQGLSLLYGDVLPRYGYEGETKYTQGLVSPDVTKIRIDIVTYHGDGTYTINQSWKEGVLGFSDGTLAFCADPRIDFTRGNKTARKATKYFSETAVKTACALIEYVNRYQSPSCLNSYQIYALKQIGIWGILNAEKGWYPGAQIEFGNGQKDSAGHNIWLKHASPVVHAGIDWAKSHKDNIQLGNCFVWEGSGQPLVTWDYKYVEKGGLSIQKISGNSSLTTNNSYYSLAGADYRIYSDRNCTNRVATIRTDAKGYAATANDALNAGTYYVKEATPSQGYELDKNVYVYTVKAGVTASQNKKTSTEPPKQGKINLLKVSAKPEVTDGNENYSLAGAEYSVYRNSACTDYVNKIVTDDKGNGSLGNLPLGIYYVKETKASQGYILDKTVYTVDISKGNNAVVEKTVTSKETPLLDPTAILLKKVDSETGQGTPQGDASLEDAQFRVKYYPVVMDTDPAQSGYTATRTWILKTDAKGYLALNDKYKVSGDEFFKNENGKPSLPYGTLTFEEIKAPNGYLLNPTIIVNKIDKSSSGGIIYQEPTQKENVLKLDVKKIQSGTTKPIEGVVFEHKKPDGSTERLTTDKNGTLSFKGLQWGNHEVKEISAPDGYAVNTNKITFTVGTDNKITITSKGTETDTDGNITIEVTKEGNISAIIENKPAPYDLLIHKINDKNAVLEGAEFTLYSDAECQNIVAKKVSAKDGTLQFDNLIVGKTYYLKETKAPEGYRIPVNPDGSDIIYTIKAESTPVDNIFKVIINGKEYDSNSTGAFKVTGTKADRIVDMTITNYIGLKLPNTGSYWMIPILILGVGLMIFGMKKKKVPHSEDEETKGNK